MVDSDVILTPEGPELNGLCGELAGQADQVGQSGEWPDSQLKACGKQGVFRWFLTSEWGGLDWTLADVVRGYLALSRACLTTTFIITQRTAACRRIASSGNEPLKHQLLPALASGEIFASIGISHLTTSRRHLSQPALVARPAPGGFVLDGYSPWITGSIHCDWIVIGAALEDGRQLLAAVPRDLPGMTCEAPADLTALSASLTGPVRFHGVRVPESWLLHGPAENLMVRGVAQTGGHDTSTLAVGLSGAAIDFLERESVLRSELAEPAEAFRAEQALLVDDLLAITAGAEPCSVEQLRIRANSLVLRSTQASLAAAKGVGFIRNHPAGRWCREALFFLVWSCPQPVMHANLCDLAGLGG